MRPARALDPILQQTRPSAGVLALAQRVALQPGQRLLDLGCGRGALGALALYREPTLHVAGIELDGAALAVARRFFAVCCGDLREATTWLRPGQADVVLANPPFFLPGQGRLSPRRARSRARHETCCTLYDVVAAAAHVLQPAGRAWFLLHPERVDDWREACARAGLGDITYCALTNRPDKDAGVIGVVATARPGGGPALVWLPSRAVDSLLPA